MEHYADVLDMASKQTPINTGFLETTERIQEKNLERLMREVESFTLKFDYRSAGEPWGSSRDSVRRACAKLRSGSVREDGDD